MATRQPNTACHSGMDTGRLYASSTPLTAAERSEMVLGLPQSFSKPHSKNMQAAAQTAVTNMTNELLRKNADMLQTTTVEVARESERGIVDIETLKYTNQSLISTLDEVLNIQKEGAAKRKEAEAELGRIEGELKQKLLEIRG